MTLRAVWNRRSSSQRGYAAASSPATRLCSRRKSVLSSTNPLCELVVSLPQANSVSRRSGGIWSGRTTSIAENSGFLTPPAYRYGGNSAPPIDCDFSRPPSCARSCAVHSGVTP